MTSLSVTPTSRSLGRDFTGLWAATGLANLADALYLLALPLLALRLTGSAGQVAGVTVVLTLAWPLFGLHAGVFVDRTDRRRMVVGVNVARALALGLLTVTVMTGTTTIAVVYAVALVLGIGETLVDTSLAALVPQAVREKEKLGRANARLEVAQNVTNQFIGPPLAGLLAGAGLAWATGASAFLYLGALAGLALMRGTYRAEPANAGLLATPAEPANAGLLATPAEPANAGLPPVPRESGRRELTAGLRFIWRNPLLRNLTVITASMNVFWAAWVAVLVVYVVAPGPVGLSPAGYGVLLTAMAAGGIAGAAVVTPLRRRLGAHVVLALDVVGTILLIGTPALTTSPYVIGAAMVVGGAGSAVWRVIVAVVRQNVTPPDLLGRVYSASRVVSWGVLPVGAALGGLIAELAGVRAVFVIGGLASIGLLGAFAATIRPRKLAAALDGLDA
jgi:MFS family permease